MSYQQINIGDTGQQVHDKLHSNFSGIGTSLVGINNNITNINEDITSVKENVIELEQDLAQVEDNIDALEDAIKNIDTSGGLPTGFVPLGIWQTNEDDFWDGFASGTLEDGLYQYEASGIEIADILPEPMFFTAAGGRANMGIEHNGRLYMGNGEANNTSLAGLIVSDLDGSNARRINHQTQTYSYFGVGQGAIGVDGNGFVYFTASPNNVLSCNTNDGVLTVNTAGTTVGREYTFHALSYHMNSHLAVMAPRESLADNLGGIWACGRSSGLPAYYYRFGVAADQTSRNVTMVNQTAFAVDAATGRLVVWENFTTLRVYNTNNTDFDIPLGAPWGGINASTQQPQNTHFTVRNGYAFFVMNYTVSGIITPFLVQVNLNSPNDVQFEQCQGLDMGLASWASVSVAQPLIEHSGDPGSLTVIVSAPNTGAPIIFCRWNYIDQNFSQYESGSSMNNTNSFAGVSDLGEGLVSLLYSVPTGFVVDLMDTYSRSVVQQWQSTTPIQFSGAEVFKASNGNYYAVGYAAGNSSMIKVSPSGDVTVTPKIFTQQTRLFLTEYNGFLFIIPANPWSVVSYAIDTNTDTIIDIEGGFFPAIRVEDGFVYFNDRTLGKPSTFLFDASQLVSKGKIARLDFIRP